MKDLSMYLTRFLFVTLVFSFLTTKTQAEDDEFNTQLMRATIKIMHEKSTATGFILRKNKEQKHILITAAHVFSNVPGDDINLIFRTKKSEGEYIKEIVKTSIRKEGKPLWIKHPTEDIAVLWIIPPKNADLPDLSVELLANDEMLKKNKVHPGDLIANLGYPHRAEANSAGFPILRNGAIATFPLSPTIKTKTFLMSGNIFEGDSGGPVYLTKANQQDDTRIILGLVSAQHFLDEDIKLIYGTSKIRHRLGLAIIIHAALIKETIELLK